jgi:hypothetical protein
MKEFKITITDHGDTTTVTAEGGGYSYIELIGYLTKAAADLAQCIPPVIKSYEKKETEVTHD